MASGTSLGEGIGLQSGNRSNYWSGRTLDIGMRNAANRDAQKKKDEEDLIKIADFKIDNSKWLPKWGKEAANVQMELMNKMAKYRQENPRTAKNRLMQDAYLAKQRVGELEVSNANAIKYLNDPGHTDPEIKRQIGSTEGSVADLTKYSDAFHQFGDNGAFSYTSVPIKEYKVTYDEKGDTVSEYGGKYRELGGNRVFNKQTYYTDEAVQRKAASLYTDPQYKLDTAWQFKNELKQITDPKEYEIALDKLTQGRALHEAELQKPGVKYDEELRNIDTGSGSGSDTKPKPMAIINPPTKRTVVTFSSDPKKPQQMSMVDVPFSVNTPNAKPVEIPISRKIFDASTGKPLEGAGNITIKPTTTFPSLRNDGTWKSVTIGKVVKSSGSDGEIPMTYGDMFTPEEMLALYGKDADKKLKQEINIEVPYESVKGTVESAHGMKDYFERFDELKGEKSSTPAKSKEAKSPSKMVTVELDGKFGEIPQDKLEDFKKKYPNAKIR